MTAAAQHDESVILKVTTRDDRRAPLLRRDGFVPMSLYGEGIEPSKVAIAQREIAPVLAHHGTTTLIDLVVDDKSPVKVLFREPQYHPVTHTLLHLDLFKVNLKEKITTEVPLEFVGESAAVLELAGTLITSKDSVEVECLPSDLPHALEINISKLATFDDTLHVSDIIVPAGVTILDEPEETVASVTEPRSEEELAALNETVEEDIEAVAVEEKGKEDETEGEVAEEKEE